MISQSDLYLLSDVSRNLNCPPHRIVYLLTSGQVPEPALRLGNRRIFTEEDICRLASRLNKQKEENHER